MAEDEEEVQTLDKVDEGAWGSERVEIGKPGWAAKGWLHAGMNRAREKGPWELSSCMTKSESVQLSW